MKVKVGGFDITCVECHKIYHKPEIEIETCYLQEWGMRNSICDSCRQSLRGANFFTYSIVKKLPWWKKIFKELMIK